jgi:hypothetical protein
MSESLFFSNDVLQTNHSQNNLNNAENNVARITEQQRQIVASIDLDYDYLTELANETALLTEILTPIACRCIADEALQAREKKQRDLARHGRVMVDLNLAMSNADFYADELKRLQKTVAAAKKYTLDDLKRDISSNPRVRTKSIAIYKNDPHTVCFVVEGIQLRPDENIYPWLNNGGDVVIAMPPIRLVIDLKNGHVFAKRCTRKHPYASGTYVRGKVAHPHVIDRHGRCCLGDYDPAVREAIANKDLPSTVFLLINFLHGAAHADTAGKGWINFIPELAAYRTGYHRKHVSVPTYDTDGRYIDTITSTYTYIDGILTRNTYSEDIAECAA